MWVALLKPTVDTHYAASPEAVCRRRWSDFLTFLTIRRYLLVPRKNHMDRALWLSIPHRTNSARYPIRGDLVSGAAKQYHGKTEQRVTEDNCEDHDQEDQQDLKFLTIGGAGNCEREVCNR